MEASVRAYLVGLGKPAASVPFVYEHAKMSLLKGEEALAARRHVASKLTESAIRELRTARRVDKPNWSLMQQLHDAGFKTNPITGQRVYDPSNCSPQLLTALWKADGGVADTVNTKQMGQTDEALEELQMRLHEHAAQLREVVPRSKPGALAKRPRSSSPASSSSGEGTDTGEPANKRRRMPEESNGETPRLAA